MDAQIVMVIISLFAVLIALILYALKIKARVKTLEEKYAKIIDIEAEIETAKKEKEKVDLEIVTLKDSYKTKRALFDELINDIAIYDESIQLAELGFYKPHFDFGTSEKYKQQIDIVRQQQKEMLSSGSAVYCNVKLTLEGSRAAGKKMTNKSIKLTMRAFNNECDAAIASTRWNNVARIEQRINKAYDAINKLNESNFIEISPEYLQLKIKEMRLAYEYAEKKHLEKEEQQELKRKLLEEAKLEKELKDSLKEEERYNKLLEKAKSEAKKATGSALEKLNDKIAKLTEELEQAHEKSQRAKSMAEQTKQGSVYIISNVGSFGENVLKIGMSRRLDPMERIKELGNASVPFAFDVHAMINTDDAPALENALHKKSLRMQE